MAENVQRSRGRPGNYKFDRGGTPAEFGPYIGIVVNNIDNTRSGRLQVWIAEFGATMPDGTPDLSDPTLWRTVSYCPPFYGTTANTGTSAGAGTYPGNRNSYGMWFTPPDIGVKVICFFAGGDPSQGYYLGCIPEQGINHMIPAIGSSAKYVPGNATQKQLFSNSPLMPVTEINDLNTAINENPRFFDQPKPVQSVQAGIFFQQGLDRDSIRGPIRSSSQRESPSSVYGISTPGKPIYQGGANEKDIKTKLEKSEIKSQDIKVIGRRGGHTFVMDDGDLEGQDTLVRIRTAKGHQITMSDDGDCFYITHANGQTWMEFGKQGTVDVYSTNSINLRTQGTLNFHADKNINMYAGGSIRFKANSSMQLEANKSIGISAQSNVSLYSKSGLTLRSDGTLAITSKKSSWNGGTALNLKAKIINLNGAPTATAPKVPPMQGYKLADTKFVEGRGWTVTPGALQTIVSRAPTHEPYPYHSRGVNNKTDLNPEATTTADPTAENTAGVPPGKYSTDSAYIETSALAVQNPIQVEDYVSEIPSSTGIGEGEE